MPRFENAYPNGPDTATKVAIGSLSNAFYVANISFLASVLALCGVWAAWRALRVRARPTPFLTDDDVGSVPSTRNKSATPRWRQSETQEHTAVDTVGPPLQFRPLRAHPFGRLCYGLCCLVSVQIIALYIVFLVDYYNGCQLRGIDNLCFYGNHFLFGSYMANGTAFFTVWVVSVLWFTGWVLCKGRVINWFRLPVGVGAATHVLVRAPDAMEVVSLYASPVVKMFRRIKAALTPAWAEGTFATVPVVDGGGRRYFVFEGLRFVCDDAKNRITRARYSVASTAAEVRKLAPGLTDAEAADRRALVGANACPFRPATFGQLLVDEFFTLFHVYQLVQYVLMFWFSYLFVAGIMTLAVVISASVSMLLVHRAQKAVEQVANVTSRVEGLRGGVWTSLDSADLVPGDIIKLAAGDRVPCDAVVLDGTCVVDESSLTGESMPTIKSALADANAAFDVRHPAPRHTLFDGTTVRQAGTGGASGVMAAVVATGMETTKGDLLAAILFPTRMIFKYDEELVVVIVILLAYSAICFVLAIDFQNRAGTKSDWVTKWIYGTAIVSQVLSPLLPVALEVGQIQAMERLKKHGINCLQPKRIMISGKTRVQCFDKTGTLTKDGLDIVGFQPATGTAMGAVLPPSDLDAAHLVGLATCHSAEKCGEIIVASEVEYKMFEATGWRFTSADGTTPVVLQSTDGSSHVVLQRNDFDHARMTQSVVVQGPTGVNEIFVKGSFETIAALCKPGSLPADFATAARQHALEGCYVLALAKRLLGPSPDAEHTNLKRDDIERDLDLMGLIIFRNEIREDSAPTISKLRDGNIRPVMVTGDSPQCGAYIARKSGMVPFLTRLMLAEFHGATGEVLWTEMTTGDEGEGSPMTTSELLAKHGADLESGAVELAVTGSAFKMLAHAGKVPALLYYIRIFARVKPEGKIRVVEQFIASGVVVGMCGDGGNDCGALRTAHTGVALSEAEASFSSPFTAKGKQVSSVEVLMREGRAALHTSVAAYKFLIMYGLIFSVLKLTCYLLGVIMCQAAYMLIEGIAIIVLPWATTLALPAKRLGKLRPSHGLLSGLNVSSVVGMWVINFAFTVGALCYMRAAPDFVPWPAKDAVSSEWWTLGDNWESTVLFFCTFFQLTSASVVFSFSASFSRPVLRNWILVGAWAALFAVGAFLLLSNENYLTFAFHIASQPYNDVPPASPTWAAYQKAGGAPSPGMSSSFRGGLFGILLANLATVAAWQKLVEPTGPLARAAHRLRPTPRPAVRL